MHNTKITHICTSIEQTDGADQIPLGKKLFHRESDVLRPLHELGGEGRSGAAERAVREQVLRREGFPWRKLPRQHCIRRLQLHIIESDCPSLGLPDALCGSKSRLLVTGDRSVIIGSPEIELLPARRCRPTVFSNGRYVFKNGQGKLFKWHLHDDAGQLSSQNWRLRRRNKNQNSPSSCFRD